MDVTGKRKIATLKHVAEKAGLSATAVSKALNGKPGVSNDTVEMVRRIAKELNYKPNNVAQSLRRNSTKTIGVIASDSSYSFFARVIKGIEDTAAKNNYNIILSNSNSLYDQEKKAIEVLLSKRIDGLIIVSPMMHSEEDIRYVNSFAIPVVFLSRRNTSIDYVATDNVRGSKMMTEHFIAKGYRDITFINLPEDNVSGTERLKGYQAGLAAHGLEFDPSRVYCCKPEIEAGKKTMLQILETGSNITAVYCGCDVIAVGVMQAIFDQGLRVPDDIAVAGYDDIELAQYIRVPLTTIRQSKYDMGCEGMDIILRKLKSNRDRRFQVTLTPELVVRSSV